MTLRGRIPVEPLSDERVTNIERSVVSQAVVAPRSSFFSSTPWPAVAAAAVLVFAVGFVGWKVGRQSVPADSVAMQPIRVDTTERTTIDIGDATLINDPNTQLVVTRPAGGVLVDMTRGKVELDVAKRANKPPFIVRAGSTDVIVVGTHFSVDYGDGTGTAIVEVTEGTVKVVRHEDSFVASVSAGNAWTLQSGVVTIAQLHTQIAASDQRVTTPVDVATANVGSAAIPTNVDTSMRDHSTTTPTGTVPGEQVRNTGTGTGSGNGYKPGKIEVTAFKEDFHKSLQSMSIAPAYNNGIADPNDAINQHNKAAAQFGDNVDPKFGESASQALYSIAVIQLVQLRDPVRALGTLDRYLDRFKHKGEHGDALWLRVRILCEKRVDEPCRHAAEVYAQEVPSGAKSGLALSISATHEE